MKKQMGPKRESLAGTNRLYDCIPGIKYETDVNFSSNITHGLGLITFLWGRRRQGKPAGERMNVEAKDAHAEALEPGCSGGKPRAGVTGQACPGHIGNN